METTRQCSQCKEVKGLSTDNFHLLLRSKRYRRVCRSCIQARHRKAAHRWRIKHPEKSRAACRQWSNTHLAHEKQRRKIKHQKLYSTSQGILHSRMRTALLAALRENKAGRHWETLVGYSVLALKQHLEKLFMKGMNWNNLGLWHIDHIIAQCHFQYSTPEDPEFQACWKLSNLQPMWGPENQAKGTQSMEAYLAQKNIAKN